MKIIFIEVGFGEKRLVLVKNKDVENFRDVLLEYYLKLKDVGGYELMCLLLRILLEMIFILSYGYMIYYLFDESGFGFVICYIRLL